MNYLNKKLGTGILFIALLFTISCNKHDKIDTRPGHILATVNKTTLDADSSIRFTDMSIRNSTREWIFEGGTPATSNDSIVSVTYNNGGRYKAMLVVTYLNQGQTPDTMQWSIAVKGKVKVNTYAIYTEDLTIAPGTGINIINNHAFNKTVNTSSPYEGSKALDFNIDNTDSWAMASIQPTGGTVDISGYTSYNLALKSSSNGTILIRLQTAAAKAIITLDVPTSEAYGFKRDGQWHMISIPMADFKANNPALNLASITDLLVLRSGTEDVRLANNYEFQLDNFYLSK